MVVLWSFRKGDVQLGSREDRRRATHKRRVARAVRSLAAAMKKHRLMIDNTAEPVQEALRDWAS